MPRSGAVWFQDTDEAGRFHLTFLPRGPIKLMVYRNPAGAGRQIKGIQYVDVAPGPDRRPDRDARRQRPAARRRLNKTTQLTTPPQADQPLNCQP